MQFIRDHSNTERYIIVLLTDHLPGQPDQPSFRAALGVVVIYIGNKIHHGLLQRIQGLRLINPVHQFRKHSFLFQGLTQLFGQIRKTVFDIQGAETNILINILKYIFEFFRNRLLVP